MKKKLVGVLVAISMLVFSASAFAATLEDAGAKVTGSVEFSVSSESPAGLLNGSASGPTLSLSALSKK